MEHVLLGKSCLLACEGGDEIIGRARVLDHLQRKRKKGRKKEKERERERERKKERERKRERERKKERMR